MDHSEYMISKVSFRSLSVYLFSKVLYILASIILFSIVFVGARVSRTEANAVNRTEVLRRQLSSEELSEADGIISRYIFCLEYAFGSTDNLRLMRNTYLLDIGNYPAEVLSNAVVMNDEEYNIVLDVMEINDDGYHKLSDRVTVETYLSEADDNKQLLLVATVYGISDEQCAQAMTAIEQFVGRIQADFGPEHSIAGWKLVSSVNSSSDSQNMTFSREERMERLSKVSGSISGLSSAMGYLTEEQKEYINSIIKPLKNNLVESSYETEITIAYLVKYAILGGIFGIVLSVGVIVLVYLINGRIKTNDDIKSSWDGIVFDPVFVPGKMNSFSRKIIRGLKTIDADAIAVNKAVAVSRISDSINEIKPKRVVFIQDSKSELCGELTDQLMTCRSIVENREVLRCQMNDFAKQCLDLSQDDAIVVLAELEKTGKKEVGRWLDFCAKNKKKVAGVVTVDQNC